MASDQSVEQSPDRASSGSHPESAAASSRIQYRIEYYDDESGAIIRNEYVKDLDDSPRSISTETVLVLIRRYNISGMNDKNAEEESKKLSAARTYETPSYHMQITSMAVVRLELILPNKPSAKFCLRGAYGFHSSIRLAKLTICNTR